MRVRWILWLLRGDDEVGVFFLNSRKHFLEFNFFFQSFGLFPKMFF